MAEAAARKKVTIPMLVEKKKKGEPIVQLAVYDYETAIIADRVGIDILCVSDTGGMVLFGHETTTSVSFEEVMFMAQAVKRGSQYGLRMVDMPYMSFHLSAQQAVDNAAKYVSQGGAEVMKCEGNQHHAKYIEAIVKAGIPVQGHIGITPDAHAAARRLRRAGQDRGARQGAGRRRAGDGRRRLLLDHDARSTTSEVCEYLAETLPVPVISLGAGNRRARRAHHRLGPLPPLRKARAAALEDLLRPRADHREGPHRLPRRGPLARLPGQGAHRVHEGRRARKFKERIGWKK